MTKETLKKHHQELKKLLEKQPKHSKETTAYIARYVGAVNHEKRKPDEQSKLIFMGIALSLKRELDKKKILFSNLSIDEQAEIWHYIFKNSNTYEEKWFALNFFNKKSMLKVAPKYWYMLKTWVEDIDNWAHSDTLSGIYATVLETNPKKYLPFFKKLNKSKNPWERRQSVVGLYFYFRLRKNPIPAKVPLELVENLLNDKHIYVQKGIGWTLREIYQVDGKAQLSFVKKNVKRIAPAGYYATVEKYPASLKAEVKKLRMAKKLN